MPHHIPTLTLLTSLSSWPRVAACPSLSIALILCEYMEVMMGRELGPRDKEPARDSGPAWFLPGSHLLVDPERDPVWTLVSSSVDWLLPH